MKRSSGVLMIGIALTLFMIAPVQNTFAQAKKKTPVLNEREHNQMDRIKQGRRSGELTNRESAKLAGEQAKIRAEEKMAKSDGKVTARERANIHRDLNEANRHIKKQKHDKQTK